MKIILTMVDWHFYNICQKLIKLNWEMGLKNQNKENYIFNTSESSSSSNLSMFSDWIKMKVCGRKEE